MNLCQTITKILNGHGSTRTAITIFVPLMTDVEAGYRIYPYKLRGSFALPVAARKGIIFHAERRYFDDNVSLSSWM